MDLRAETMAEMEAWLEERRLAIILLAQADLDVMTRAVACFGSAKAAGLFLTAPAPALGGRTPLEVAMENDGKERVLELIAAIEHGVYH